jgi:hypothetical protein
LELRLPSFLRPRRKYEVNESHRIVVFARRKLKQVKIFLEWRGFPNSNELSFVSRMNELETQGFTFAEVIRATAPKVLGEGPSQILLRWVGKKARLKPRLFVKALRKEFAQESTKSLHSDYDRGYFQALESYMRKLERGGPPSQTAGPPQPK